MKNHRRAWIIVAMVVGGAFAASKVLPPPSNRSQTSLQHPDPLLRTRRYQASIEEVASAVQKAAQSLRTYGQRWTFVSSSAEAGPPAEKTLHFVVPVLVFKDDLTVTLREDDGAISVDVASQSRVGKGDFGENRRHLLQLLEALDERMKN
jgi:hypothetical protein